MTFKLPIIHSPASDVLSLLIRIGEHLRYESVYQHKYALLVSFQIRYQQKLSAYITDPEQHPEDRISADPKPKGAVQHCFRILAQKLHPDRLKQRNLNSHERSKFYALMQEANMLYQQGDHRGLEQILRNIQDPASEEEKRASHISFLEAEIYNLVVKTSTLEKSHFWKLHQAESTLAEEGRDLLSELSLAFKHRNQTSAQVQ